MPCSEMSRACVRSARLAWLRKDGANLDNLGERQPFLTAAIAGRLQEVTHALQDQGPHFLQQQLTRRAALRSSGKMSMAISNRTAPTDRGRCSRTWTSRPGSPAP